MNKQITWHREWWSAQLDGMSRSYVLCCCTNGRHHPDFHLNLTKLNTLQTQATRSETALREIADRSEDPAYALEVDLWHINGIARAALTSTTPKGADDA